jgi:hypothetical protein
LHAGESVTVHLKVEGKLPANAKVKVSALNINPVTTKLG